LRDWRVRRDAAGRGRLELEFSEPVRGPWDVVVDLVPLRPAPPSDGNTYFPLPLPTPHGKRDLNSRRLAYRAPGLNVDFANPKPMVEKSQEEFVAQWVGPNRPAPRQIKGTCILPRDDRPGTFPQVRLKPVVAAGRATQDVRWLVGPRHADWSATVHLTSLAPAGSEWLYLEWDMQAKQSVTLASVVAVNGPAVRRWNQSAGRLQVWLERPAREAAVELSGWLTLPAGNETRLDLPCLRLLNVPDTRTTVRLVPMSGIMLTQTGPLQNLTRQAPGNTRDLTFEAMVPSDGGAVAPSYGAAWLVRPAAVEAAARVLTLVQTRDKQLTFIATARLQIGRGELRTVVVRLRDWATGPKGGVALTTPGATIRSERTSGGERIWTLDLPPGITKDYELTLTGKAEAAGGAWAPDVTVIPMSYGDGIHPARPPASTSNERWLVVAEKELGHESQRKLESVADVAKMLENWPRAAAAITGSAVAAWKLPSTDASTDPGWRMRLMPTSSGGGRSAQTIRLFLAERSAAVTDGRRWLHEASYWLTHDASVKLSIALPAPARVVSASVDGVDVAAEQPEPTKVDVPLPVQAGVCRVRLRWVYDEESLTAPNLACPIIEGTEAPTLWTVHVPDGCRGESSGAVPLRSGLARLAEAEMRRADAQLRLSRHLRERITARASMDAESRALLDDLAAAQRRFYQHVRQADQLQALAVAGGSESLAGALSRLKDENAAAMKGEPFESRRAEGERDAQRGSASRPAAVEDTETTEFAHSGWSAMRGSLTERGTALVGWDDALGESNAPRLQLTTIAEQQARAAWLGASGWLALLIVLLAATRRPWLLRRTRPFWPEQLLLLGAIGYWLAGPRLVVLLLVAAWAVVRIVRAARFIARLWHRWTSRPEPSTSAARA
jgi:hypothetical protein